LVLSSAFKMLASNKLTQNKGKCRNHIERKAKFGKKSAQSIKLSVNAKTMTLTLQRAHLPAFFQGRQASVSHVPNKTIFHKRKLEFWRDGLLVHPPNDHEREVLH